MLAFLLECALSVAKGYPGTPHVPGYSIPGFGEDSGIPNCLTALYNNVPSDPHFSCVVCSEGFHLSFVDDPEFPHLICEKDPPPVLLECPSPEPCVCEECPTMNECPEVVCPTLPECPEVVCEECPSPEPCVCEECPTMNECPEVVCEECPTMNECPEVVCPTFPECASPEPCVCEECPTMNECPEVVCEECPTMNECPEVVCPTFPECPEVVCPTFPECPEVVCEECTTMNECPEVVCPTFPEVFSFTSQNELNFSEISTLFEDIYETSSVDPDEISNISFGVIGFIIVFILFCICLFALIFLLCKNKHRGVSSSTQSSQEEMSGEIMSSNSEIDLPQPSTLNPSLITEISLDPFQLPEDEPSS